MAPPLVDHGRLNAPTFRRRAPWSSIGVRGSRVRPHRRAVTAITADSTPARYAVVRRPSTAPALLIVFAAVAAGIYRVVPDPSPAYRRILQALGGVANIGPTATRTRIVVAVVVALLAIAASGQSWRRLQAAVTAAAVYTVLIGVHDVAAGWWSHLRPVEHIPATQMLQPLVAGALGLLGSVVMHYRLPPAVAVHRQSVHTQRRASVVLFALTAVVATATYAVVFALLDRPSLFLRTLPVLVLSTGMLPFSLAQTPLLYWLGRRAAERPATRTLPSVAILIPALDEAEHIGSCLAAIERAEVRYGGRCRVVVVDNTSRDDTVAVATRHLRRSPTLRGDVLMCGEPGKSRALNMGLLQITEDLVLRVDADTIIDEDAIRLLVAHFAAEGVGAAGGLPLPNGTTTWISRMRLIEVQLNVAIRRVAHNAVQSVMCLPGNVAMYRRDLLAQLDGFAEGINGEDTDITLRIARSGLRIVVDPQVRARTAVPATLGELREQRTRWARAGYHVASRNRGLIRFAEGPMGFWYFPLGIVAIHLRVLLFPLLVGMVAAAAPEGGARIAESLDLIAAATVARLAVAAVVLVAAGQWRAVPWLAGYIPFRLIVLFHGLEAFLTLPLRDRPATRPRPGRTDKWTALLRGHRRIGSIRPNSQIAQ